MAELMPFVCKDTGITLLVRKVSPLLAIELRKAYPPPEPPTQEVDYGDGKKVMEENTASPAYAKALQVYNEKFEQKMRELYIERGVTVEMTPEIQQEVMDLRDYWRKRHEKELKESDLVVYVSYIAIGTAEDLEDLLTTIMRRSQPAREDVELAKASFRN